MSFLGVEASLTGRRWFGPAPEHQRKAEALSQQTGLPDALCQVLAKREIDAPDVDAFLNPTLKELLPDPRSIKDMEKAAARILNAVHGSETIAIFADYDVDGGSSAALLIDWLRQMGRSTTLYVPDRISEGYGPNEPAMRKLAAQHDLIVCVDCGTLSHDAIAAAADADVIVLDHHLGGETLPPALAVVNPNRQDESGDLAHLCAAAVVFLLLVETRRQLRKMDRTSPNLMAMLDLVALATVADVAPLAGVNRAFVRQGLKIMALRQRPGLAALADVTKLDKAPSSQTLGFIFGPRVNAGGRIGKADLGARLLSTNDPNEALSIAQKLDELNGERRAVEDQVRLAATKQAEERGLTAPLVWAAGEGWHPGVVGIVASRLKESTNRPAIVIGLDGDEGKGSGRSVTGIDLGAQIHRLAQEGLLIKGGGHKMAAGLTVARDKLDEAMERLTELLAKQGAGELGAADLKVDGALMPGGASVDLIEQLENAGPFGASSPAPRFVFPEMQIAFAKKVGTSHLKLSFSDGTGPRIDAISFGAFDGPIGEILMNHSGQRFHLAGRLELNHWGGRTMVQLRLEDAARA